MKKVVLIALVLVMFGAVLSEAAGQKVALVGRISWCPDSDGAAGGNRDFDVMPHFSMVDETLDYLTQEWGYFPILMPDYVAQYMVNDGQDVEGRGYDMYVNPGIYMAQPDFFQMNNYDLIYVTGTCWSSIAPPLAEVPIPVIMGEHSCVGTRAKLGSLGMFHGESSGDHNGFDTIVLTEEGKSHPLTAGMPDEIVVWGDGPDGPPENPGAAWNGLHDDVYSAAEGTVVLAVWADNPDQAALAVTDEGGALAGDYTAPARRVMPFCNGGAVRPENGSELPPVWVTTWDYLTDDGTELMQRTYRWAMGEDPTPVTKWAQK